MSRTLVVIALCSVLAAGCGGSGRYLQRGVERYEHADYRGALKQWNELNGSEGSMNDRVLVRYLVYRGLTHYHMAQRSLALIFLTRAKEVYPNVPPTTLKTETVAEMDKALTELNAPRAAKSDAGAPAKAESSATSAGTAAPSTPSPASTGEALAGSKAPPTKSGTANAGPAPAKSGTASAGPAPAKTAGANAGPAPAKATSPAPAKTTQPTTRTSPAVQSTSPK